MTRSRPSSRRDLLRAGIAAAAIAPAAVSHRLAQAAAAPAAAADPWRGLKVGVATYTLNRLPLDKALEALKRLDVHYCSIKESHLPLRSSAAQRKEVAAKFKAAGVTPLSCGNVGMNDNEADLRNAFEYARDAGIPVIVCKPTKASLPTLDKLVKEFDIKLAIHNHGPEDKVWPTPYEPWEAIQSFDPRIGLCIDVGHTKRGGVDPAEAIRKCSARLYDLHIKDIDGTQAKSRPTEIGRGVLDIPSILKALFDIDFKYHVGIEFEKNLNDPIPGTAESLGYLRGLLVRGV
ncbi:MAG: sugar phosphate isomerase/epimerase [Isosphaeraceae bacterium]|nr:sugar phosphate isomerase/epimerase [Isosphaeraceae bacterium]